MADTSRRGKGVQATQLLYDYFLSMAQGEGASDEIRVDIQGQSFGALDVEISSERARKNVDSKSTSSTYTWEVFDPSDLAAIREVSGVLEETGGTNSADFKIIGTNKDNAATPSGIDPDDWDTILAGTTVSAGSELHIHEPAAGVDKIAVGYKDGSGSATISYDVDVANLDNLVEAIEQVENRIGPTSESPNRDPAGTDSGLRSLLGALVEQIQDVLASQDAADELRMDLAAQALNQVATKLELTDGSSFSAIHRIGNAILAALTATQAQVNVAAGAGNLGTNGEVSVSLTQQNGRPVSYVIEELDGNISSYDVVMRVFETSNLNNQVGNDITLHSGKTGQVSDAADCPGEHIKLVAVNNDGSNTGSMDISTYRTQG